MSSLESDPTFQQTAQPSSSKQSFVQNNEAMSIRLSASERTGRKSYKLSSNKKTGGRKEPVWSRVLEEALLDGLEKYRLNSKSERTPQRFTKRNKSIALHIFRITGTRRTAKQVSSRLQQISESTKDPEINRLITCRDPWPDPVSPTALSEQSSPSLLAESPSSPFPTEFNTPPSTSYAPMTLDRSEGSTSLCAQLLSDINDSYLGLDADLTPQGVHFILRVNQRDFFAERVPFCDARKMSGIPCSTLFGHIPTLSIGSWRLSPNTQHICKFTVSLEGTNPIHSEETYMSIRPDPHGERHIYVTHFLPSFWSGISQSHHDSYTVTADIIEIDSTQVRNIVHNLAILIGPLSSGQSYTQPLLYENDAGAPNLQYGFSHNLLSFDNMPDHMSLIYHQTSTNPFSVWGKAVPDFCNVYSPRLEETNQDCGYPDFPAYSASHI